MGSCCNKCTAVVHVEQQLQQQHQQQQQQPNSVNEEVNRQQPQSIAEINNSNLVDTNMSSHQSKDCYDLNNGREFSDSQSHQRHEQPFSNVRKDSEPLQQTRACCTPGQRQQVHQRHEEQPDKTFMYHQQHPETTTKQRQNDLVRCQQQKLEIHRVQSCDDETPSACSRCFVSTSPPPSPLLSYSMTVDTTVGPDVKELTENIKTCRQSLLHILNVTNSGLLDELLSVRLLTQQQIELIRVRPTVYSKVDQLLSDISSLTDEQLGQFLFALDKTGQSYVTNYIRCNGRRPKSNPNNWPIYGHSQWNNIQQNLPKLKEMTDSRNGLLDEMYSMQCISSRQMSCIEVHMSDDDRNDQLFCIIQRQSFRDFNKFIKCLASTKQCAVIALLQPDSKHRCLSEQHLQMIQQNHTYLIENIESRDSILLSELRAADCITERQREYIEAASTQTESNKRLLTIIRRGCEVDLSLFVSCLQRANQHHIAAIITDGGVIAQINAKTSSCHNVKEGEDCIVTRYQLLIRTRGGREVSDNSFANQIVDVLQRFGIDVDLVAMKTRNSIGLFFLCKSVHGLRFLHDLYTTYELDAIVQQLFVMLCSSQMVRVDRLIWSMADFNKCAQYLSMTADLPVHSRLYQLASLTTDDAAAYALNCSVEIGKLHHELVEKVLLKAVSQLFVVLSKMTSSDAEVCSLTTLGAVCSYWWQTIKCRAWNKKLVKNYMSFVRRPHQAKTQLKARLRMEARSVVGVAQLLCKLYVATMGCSAIHVFDLNPPYSRLDDIAIKNLIETADIATCRATNNLFVADCVTRDIWCVSVHRGNNEVNKFDRTPFIPKTISINPTRLTIVPYDGRSLHVYPARGDKENISMPDFMRVHHAVEVHNCNSFVVCYTDLQSARPELRTICEIDKSGIVLRQCCVNTHSSTLLVVRPCYLSFSFEPRPLSFDQQSSTLSDSFLMVADEERKQIQLFNSKLTLQRVLLNQLDDLLEIDYSDETRLLAVAYSYSNRVDLFCV